MVLGDEAGRDRAGDRQRAERRTRADRRRARVPAGEHDRRDREALGHLVEEDGHGEERAERGSDHEAGGDRDAVEERVHAEAEQREPARRGIEERLGMHLFAEVEVGRDRVLEEVNAEVADEDEEEGVRDVSALGQHPDECRREHEAGPGGDEVPERCLPSPVGGHDEHGAREIGGRRDRREGQVC